MSTQTRTQRVVSRVVSGIVIAFIASIVLLKVGGTLATKQLNKEREAVTVVTYANERTPMSSMLNDCKKRGGTDVKFMLYGNPVRNPQFRWTCVK